MIEGDEKRRGRRRDERWESVYAMRLPMTKIDRVAVGSISQTSWVERGVDLNKTHLTGPSFPPSETAAWCVDDSMLEQMQ
jgi:hypothetical protein